MARKTRFGKCKLCGKKARLSFEHVPPRCTFNDKSVKLISGDKMLGNDDRMPWELKDLKGVIQQKGKGGYYLCEQCNNTSGSWYIPFYEEFIKGILYVLQKNDLTDAPAVGVHISKFRPLPIIKQILLMFCDINNDCFKDDGLRAFLLNKEQKEGFNDKKYKLYAYITRGPLERQNAVMCKIMGINANPQIVTVTEIASFPVGFALYIDLPDGYIPQGALINTFAEYNYEDECHADMVLPLLECNTVFSGDYRSQEEIKALVEDTNRKLKQLQE